MTAPGITVAILVFPETTASVVYGMYALFLSTGRDWPVLTEGKPGPEMIRPVLTARRAGPLTKAYGASGSNIRSELWSYSDRLSLFPGE